MLDDEYAEQTEEDAVKHAEEKYGAHAQARNSLWVALWPNHCRSCGGWGGSSYPATGPSYSSGGEPGGFDPCEALSEYQCHRCGGQLASLETHGTLELGPCEKCGWNFDDGVLE